MAREIKMSQALRLLYKELAFLDTRMSTALKGIRTVTVGRTTAIVNGLSSTGFAHYLYLDARRDAVLDRIKDEIVK
jgi:hypothetical protein